MDAAPSLVAGLLFLGSTAHFGAVHALSGLPLQAAFMSAMIFVISFLAYKRNRSPGLLALAATLPAGVAAHPTAFAALPLCLCHPFPRKDSLGRVGLAMVVGLPAAASLAVLYLTATDLPTLSHRFGSLLMLADRLVLTAYWLPLVPVYEPASWEHLVGLPLLAILGLLCRRRGVAAAWSVWTLSTLLLAALVMPQHGAEEDLSRFLYLPVAGTSTLLALGLVRLGKRPGAAQRTLFATLLVLVAISGLIAQRKAQAVSLYLLGESYWRGGDLASSVGLLEKAAQDGPGVIPLYSALLKQCEASIGLGRDPGPALQTALGLFPNQQEILLFELALRATGSDSTTQRTAERQLESIVGYIDEGSADLLARYLHNFGFAHYREGRAADAVAAYERALTFDPERFSTLKNLSEVLVATRQLDRAVRSLEQALLLRADDPTVHLVLGDLYSRTGRLSEAADAYRNAVQLEPQDVEAYRRLGAVLSGMGQWRQAEAVLLQATRLFPRDARLHRRLGEARMQGGEVHGALMAFDRAVTLGLREARTHLDRARLLNEAGRGEEALAAHRHILVADLVGLDGGLLVDTGLSLYHMGATADAGRAYKRALEHDPANMMARLNLAWCLYLENDLDGAIVAYRAVLAQDRGNHVTQFYLGLAHLARGDVDLAKEIYTQAMALSSREEVADLGILADLRALIARGVQAEAARAIIAILGGRQ